MLADVLRELPRQQRAHYRAWTRRALDGVRPTHPTPPQTGAQTVARGNRAPRPGTAEGLLDNAQLRALTKWRNEHHPGASITAVLTSRMFRALVEAGVPMRPDGFYSLFDLRSLLPEGAPTTGNLAKSLLLLADLADPAAVDRAMREAIDTRRALPALIGGAVATRLRGRSAPTPAHTPAQTPDQTQPVSTGPITLTFNSMPTLPGLAALPWADGPRRYVGLGYPISTDGISVFAVRFRDRMEISVSFDRARIDPDQVQRAIAAVPLTVPLAVPTAEPAAGAGH